MQASWMVGGGGGNFYLLFPQTCMGSQVLTEEDTCQASERAVPGSINLMWSTFQFFIWLVSVKDGLLSPASKSHSISVSWKCFLHASLLFWSVVSQLRGTMISGPIREYFWHLPSTDEERRCTVRNSNPVDSALLFPVRFLPNFALNASQSWFFRSDIL